MRTHRKKRRSPQDPTVAADADCLSVAEFCRRNGISKPFYFKLRAQGLGPEEIRLGARVLITRQSAEKWRAERMRASKRGSSASAVAASP
jgi:hypothetical protein